VQMPSTPGAPQQLRIPMATAPASVVLDPEVELLASFTIVKR